MSVATAFERAVAAYQRGALEESAALCSAVLAEQSNHIDAMNLSGAICMARGDVATALAQFTRLTEIQPRFAEGFNNRGVALQRLGRLDEAERSYRRALDLAPAHIDALYNLAAVHGERSRWEQALAAYQRVIQLRPGHAPAWNNRGNVLQKLGRWVDAVESHRRAIALRPNADAFNNLGTALTALRRLEEARHCFDEALRLRPRYPEALTNRSIVLRDMGDSTGALEDVDVALRLAPTHADVHNNRGIVLEDVGRFDEAMESYQQALKLRPGFGEAQWNESLLLLLRGDYESGLPLYESRWATQELARHARRFDAPLWLGNEPLEGKSILLHAEQGAGDNIQFARYIALVQERAGEVLVESPAALIRLFSASFSGIRIVQKGARLPALDFHCPLGSLPLALGTTLSSIPTPGAYLQVDAQKKQQWAERLGPPAKRRIGLAWSGNPAHRNDRNRSILLARLASVLELDAEFHALQTDLREADRTVASGLSQLRLWNSHIVDFADTAAIADLMDLVVSVDTSAAHLAAALGKPTWVLLPAKPDWRWLLGRSDSPWYASVRIFRQTRAGCWDDVVGAVRGALAQQFDPRT